MSRQQGSSVECTTETTSTSLAENPSEDQSNVQGHTMECINEIKNLADNSLSGLETITVERSDNLFDNNKPGEHKKVEKKDAAVQVNCRLIKIADFHAYCESECQHGRKVQSALFLNEMGSIAKFRKLSGPVLVHGDRIRKRSAMLTFSQMRELMSQADQDVSGDTTLEVSNDTNIDKAVAGKNDDRHSSVDVRATDQISMPSKCMHDQVKALMSQARELGVLKVKTEATSRDTETTRVSPGGSLGGCIAEALRQCEMVLPKYGGHSVEMVLPNNDGRAGGKGSDGTGSTRSSGSSVGSKGGDSGSDGLYVNSTCDSDGSDDDDDSDDVRVIDDDDDDVKVIDDDDVKVIDDDDEENLMPTRTVRRASRRIISSSSEEENKGDKKTNSSTSQWVRRSARERFKCRHCDRMFTDQNQCQVHETEHSPTVVSCVACSMEFPNEDALIQHAETVHLQSPKVNRMKMSSETLSSPLTRQSIPSGLKRANPDPDDTDEQSPSKRTSKAMLIFKCVDCVGAFRSPADLNNHRKVHLLRSREKGPKTLTRGTGQPEEDQPNKPNLLSVTPKTQSSTPNVQAGTQNVLSNTPKVHSSASTAPIVHPVKPMMQSVQVSSVMSKVKQSGGIKCSKCSWVFFGREKLNEHEAKVHKITNPTKDAGEKGKDTQDVGIEKKLGHPKKVVSDTDTTSTDTDSDLDTNADSSSSSVKLPVSSHSKREMKQCPHCHLSFSCPETFKRHVGGHACLSGYYCGSCDFVCQTERGLKTHFNRKHARKGRVRKQETVASADKDDEGEDVASADCSDDASYKPGESGPLRPSLKVSSNLFKKRSHNDSPS